MSDEITNDQTTNARRLIHLLERLRPQMIGPALRRLKELQLSHSHLRMLRILHEHRLIAMKDLADQLQITPPSVTALTRRLVQTGIVERRPHPEDSRIQLLDLSEAGRELHRQLQAEHMERMERILARLSPAEQAQFLDLLDRATRPDEQPRGCLHPQISPTTEPPALDPDAA